MSTSTNKFCIHRNLDIKRTLYISSQEKECNEFLLCLVVPSIHKTVPAMICIILNYVNQNYFLFSETCLKSYLVDILKHEKSKIILKRIRNFWMRYKLYLVGFNECSIYHRLASIYAYLQIYIVVLEEYRCMLYKMNQLLEWILYLNGMISKVY